MLAPIGRMTPGRFPSLWLSALLACLSISTGSHPAGAEVVTSRAAAKKQSRPKRRSAEQGTFLSRLLFGPKEFRRRPSRNRSREYVRSEMRRGLESGRDQFLVHGASAHSSHPYFAGQIQDARNLVHQLARKAGRTVLRIEEVEDLESQFAGTKRLRVTLAPRASPSRSGDVGTQHKQKLSGT